MVYFRVVPQLNKATAAVLVTPRGHDTRKDKFLMPPQDTTRISPVKLCECGCGQPAPISQYTSAPRGYIKGQARRFIAGHHLRGRPRKGKVHPIGPRFWSMVDRRGPDDCWPWTGDLSVRGYGRIWYQGKTRYAHRVSYELHYAPISEGMFVCHSCDNPRCVNPAHLFLGTAADNSKDMTVKGRAAEGERHGTCKLKEGDIPAIRKLATEGLTYTEIGTRYGVAYGVISRVVRCETWKDVQ